MSTLAKIIAAVVALAALVAAGLWVAGWGPFHSPSAAAKQLPKVAASVAKVQAQASVAAGKAETATHARIATIEKRTESNVAKVRAAPPELSDREWLGSMCQSAIYTGDPACRGSGGQP